MTDNPLKLVFLPPGPPGRLDLDRVYVRYPDGCVTGFAVHRHISVEFALDFHAGMHEQPTPPEETA